MIDTFTLVRLVIVISLVGFVLLERRHGKSTHYHVGNSVFTIGFSLALFIDLFPDRLRIPVAVVAFVLVNAGGYTIYRERRSTSDIST